MKIIKNINNNHAIAIDSKGNQLVVNGKGIGFGGVPREITDLSLVERTYYNVDEQYISMINDIPEEIIDISSQIVMKAQTILDYPISSNIVFTLADHINFCIERYKKSMKISLPIVYDIEQLYDREMEIGKYGLDLIKKRLGLYLPKEEAAYIALHIISAQQQQNEREQLNNEILEDITSIIEEQYGMIINRENFNFSRFATHMRYLLKRGESKHLVSSDNKKLFENMKDSNTKNYECIEKISEYFKKKVNLELNDEEKLYLMLHVNRLCTREDCDR